ncbi:hypothetical protein BZG36_03784 [Bifiguratus adelaidae]|uniref:Zn(2)-C6 fungal-type domain-containing protein n=1 Tax=Bifiguratus adelaidae TaxID=1938954 RepID=A0A261XXV7_9FUNG|nr:hypothetical protein BZG36_03784 [Bifiguratus adelaidae]
MSGEPQGSSSVAPRITRAHRRGTGGTAGLYEEDPPADNAETLKQSKVVLSCLRCRTKKAKCSHEMPACSRCVKGNYDCIYPTVPPKLSELSTSINLAKAALTTLEARIAAIEARNATKQGLDSSEADQDKVHSAHSNLSGGTLLDSQESTHSSSRLSCNGSLQGLEGELMTNDPYHRARHHSSQPSLPSVHVHDRARKSADRSHETSSSEGGKMTANDATVFKMRREKHAGLTLPWAVHSTGKGLTIETSVQNMSDLSSIIYQLRNQLRSKLDVHDSDGDADATAFDDEESANSGKSSLIGDLPTQEQLKSEIASCVESDNITMNPATSPHQYWTDHDVPNDSHNLSITSIITDILIDSFFNHPCCYAPLPVLDKPSFISRYHSNDDQICPHQMLIYGICAPAAIYSARRHPTSSLLPQVDDSKASIELANAFYHAGIQLLDNAFDDSHIDVILSIFYLGFFHNNIHSAPYVWTVRMTLAVRMAFDLNLHSESKYAENYLDPEANMQARRLFWAIYDHSLWVAISTGGKSVIPRHSVTVELPYPRHPVDIMHFDPVDDQETILNQKVRLTRLFFYHHIRLMCIYEDLQAARLEHDASAKTTEQLHSSLDEWFEALPACFQTTDRKDMSHFHLTLTVWLHVHHHLAFVWLYQHYLLDTSNENRDLHQLALATAVWAAQGIVGKTANLVQTGSDCHYSIHAVIFASWVFEKLIRGIRQGILHDGDLASPPRSPAWKDRERSRTSSPSLRSPSNSPFTPLRLDANHFKKVAIKSIQANIWTVEHAHSTMDGWSLYVNFLHMLQDRADKLLKGETSDISQRGWDACYTGLQDMGIA